MNIRTKLLITFGVVVAVPLFLISLVFFGFMSMQPAEVATPQIREFLGEMLVSVILIMAMTCSFLMAWIYRSILTPIETLKKATRNIRDGNLDFEVEIGDDDEIGELCADFEEMRIRLKESTEEKVVFDSQNKELISNISHDLKTPITAVKGYVEGLLDGVADTPEKQKKYLRTIYNKANDMDRLINELTFYSKIDTNRIPYTFNKINVKEYFDDCFEDIGMEMSQQQISLSYDNKVAPDVMVIADAEQIKRVINNIVGNSVKYMDKPDKSMWEILCRWRSRIMAGESRQRIFHIYLTGSTGQIRQEIPRKEEVASVFPLSIRSWKTMEERSGQPAEKEKERLCISFLENIRRYRLMSKILIIEDEEAIADLEKDYLELSGFEVEIEGRGDSGLTRALSEEFDLIILDLMLPGVDGFEICRNIREEKNIPVIMVSAKKDDIDKIRGLGLGADDYMTKPFSPSELVARVKAHLARYERLVGSGIQENEIIEIRGIKIDKTARRVWVNGEEKQFTSKEFDLLTFLAQNPNHVFTKEELFSKIWDMESIGDIATVTVHIKKIREKIEFNTAKPQYIETIWGVGYRFKV